MLYAVLVSDFLPGSICSVQASVKNRLGAYFKRNRVESHFWNMMQQVRWNHKHCLEWSVVAVNIKSNNISGYKPVLLMKSPQRLQYVSGGSIWQPTSLVAGTCSNVLPVCRERLEVTLMSLHV